VCFWLWSILPEASDLTFDYPVNTHPSLSKPGTIQVERGDCRLRDVHGHGNGYE